MGNIKAPASHPHRSGDGDLRRLAGDRLRSQILDAIEEYGREHHCPPTIRDICSAVKIESTGHVAYHVRILEQEGLISRAAGRSRGLMLTRPAGLPVRGTIAAGDPLDQFDEGEPEILDFGELATAMTAIPRSAAEGIYALRVRGTSMIEDGILNGDYVLIAPGPTARNGEIAVATHNTANGGRGAATLKRIFASYEGVRLQPANAELEPRFIPAKEWKREWTVQGTVVAVYRQYASDRAPALRRA